ncbi:MAG: threonine synthase [Lachnospiraceae bacterium]|nr:threonine synthase [Lachnospiraceae bacterium]
MNVTYQSTRSNGKKLTASQAILQGIALDGGLFVPDHIPLFLRSFSDLKAMSYQQVAFEVMKLYLSDFSEAELKGCIEKAYDGKFSDPAIAPLKEAGGVYYLELFHGKTIAFKDMALSILPHLMSVSAKKNDLQEEIVILTATSGDTGKAALAGFASVPGIKIIVFYPKDGVSLIQERQMVTQTGDNTHVVAIKGNFDDAQTAVKHIFGNEGMRKRLRERGYIFSSANSINIGRLIPQITYYFYAYCELLRRGKISAGEKINFAVPTGNFGNILAAYYAKEMGLPIEKLVCASNENKVLYDFFQSGIYDKNRDFVLTSSPSMDILVSSNLERLIYHIADNDPEKCKDLMQNLTKEGQYAITSLMKEKLKDFAGGFASEADTVNAIKRVYEKSGYVIDPHTAVADFVYQKHFALDNTKTVIVSTASPYKFLKSVVTALEKESAELDEFALIDRLNHLSKIKIPAAIEELKTAAIRHKTVCEIEDMPRVVEDFLG